MRIAAALVLSLILLPPVLAAGDRATWYEKSGFYFRVSQEGRETDNMTAWACGATARIQLLYTVSFRSSDVGTCGAAKGLAWHPGQVVSATLPCEGVESVWKQFRGAKGENPSEFIDAHDGHPSGKQIASYFDTACRAQVQPTQGTR